MLIFSKKKHTFGNVFNLTSFFDIYSLSGIFYLNSFFGIDSFGGTFRHTPFFNISSSDSIIDLTSFLISSFGSIFIFFLFSLLIIGFILELPPA